MLGEFAPIVNAESMQMTVETIKTAYDSKLITLDRYIHLLVFLNSNTCMLESEGKIEYDDLLELDSLISSLIEKALEE